MYTGVSDSNTLLQEHYFRCTVLQSAKKKKTVPVHTSPLRDVAGGQMAYGKLWSLPKYSTILVHVMNTAELSKVGLSEKLFFVWANCWNTDSAMQGAQVPVFVPESDVTKAHIRVFIQSTFHILYNIEIHYIFVGMVILDEPIL